MSTPAEQVVEAYPLEHHLARFKHDPLGHVLFSYPWGESGTPLAEPPYDFPDTWQIEELERLSQWLKDGRRGAYQLAIASGHGIGKGAFVAMLVKWFLDTHIQPQIVVTANTGDQLDSKTWREVTKWHRMSLSHEFYDRTATKLSRKGYEDTWKASALKWSEERSEGFAGTHEKSVMMLMDESSAIPDVIWTATDGSMSTEGAIWIALGNPTRNTGRFRDCFYKFKQRWRHRQIDSRTCKFADKAWADAVIEDYGEDSDISRVRVKGEFPRASSIQFYSSDEIETAMQRHHGPEVYAGHNKFIGVDVARSGLNASVIAQRQGYKVFPLHKYPGDMDGPTLALLVKELDDEWKSDAIMVDFTGVGCSVYDSLVTLKLKHKVFAIVSADRDKNRIDRERYYNLRAQMNCNMRDAVRENLDLPQDTDLRNEMESIEYEWDTSTDVIKMAKKDSDNSPDCVDAIALTYARKIVPKHARPQSQLPDTRYIV